VQILLDRLSAPERSAPSLPLDLELVLQGWVLKNGIESTIVVSK
jgi:hypothetical protein